MILVEYLIVSSIIAFTITFIGVDAWLYVSKKLNLVGKDMNKYEERYVSEAGGVWVAVGASFGILALIALYRYINGYYYNMELFMALSLLLFMASFLGFLDDLLGWKKGLNIWQRIVFMGPLALPLVVIKAGVSTMAIPVIGKVNFGIFYPLLLVPVGVIGAANAFNMLAGYNGLEASMAITLMLFTGVYAYLKGIEPIVYASIIMMAALIAFLKYNWFPAKVFPGNSMTYGFGAYYASLVILGNFEKFGVLLFTLYFIELALFIRGLKNGVYKENFGIPSPDGTLKPPYEKSYSLTHLAIKLLIRTRGYATERSVVALLVGLQIIVGLIAMYVSYYEII